MLERLLPIEKDLFFLINGTHNTYSDAIMWLYSGMLVWLPLIIFFLFMLVYKTNWKIWLPVILGIALVFLCCDQFANLLKHGIARYRPTHHEMFAEHVRTLFGYTGGKYGFISGHAANAFGFATFTAFIFKYRPYTFTIFTWALIMAYSRVYLGVHFISDVIGGMIAGILIGSLIFLLYLWLYKKICIPESRTSPYLAYDKRRKRVITCTIIFYIMAFSIFSKILVHYFYT